MGCCCGRDTKFTPRHHIVLDFMKGDGYLKTVWSSFKLNNESHSCLEYDEFSALLFVSMEILDKMQPHHSRQLSVQFLDKKDMNASINLDEITREETQALDELQKAIGIMAPKLALKFDKDGDGVFSWQEFKDFGEYLKNEYQRALRNESYQAPQIQNEKSSANLLS